MREQRRVFVLLLIICILMPSEVSVFGVSTISGSNVWRILQVGSNLDVFTQRGGTGNLAPSDAFAPEELLILYSNVTYSDSPVQNKSVTFEIHDATGNVRATLGKYTNASGIATASFRLPSSGSPGVEDPSVFGNWTVISTAELDGNAVSDTVTFECGWLVKVVSVEPGTHLNGNWYSKTVFHKLEPLEVMVTLRSICFSSQNIYLSVDYFDAQGYPFFDNGLQYTKMGRTTENVTVRLERIPTWTRVGNARLQAVVTSKPVEQGGTALCPPISNFTAISSLHWWNYSWDRRKKVEVCENSGHSRTMLSVEITFEHGGDTQADGSDIRVIAETSEILCTVIEINGTHATVRIEISLLAFQARTVFIYYGNRNSSTPGFLLDSSKELDVSTTLSSEPTTVVIPDTIAVPDDFSSLQQAINHANTADTVFAEKGTYHQAVFLNNSVVLMGESVTQTILDGDGSRNVTVVTKDNVTVADLTIRNSGNHAPFAGIVLDRVENCTVTSTNIKDCYYGVSLSQSPNNIIETNNVTGNTKGIYLFNSSGCDVSGNVFKGNNVAVYADASANCNQIHENSIRENTIGIELSSSSNNIVSKDTITGNLKGVRIAGGDARNNTVCKNDIANSGQYGVGLFSSQGNIVTENSIGLNAYGVWLNGASDNRFFFNNFTGNSTQVFVEVTSSGNVWNDCYPWGGNYWSDLGATDVYSGVVQNETGTDGISDEPYVIDASNLDNYPLMRPWVPFENGPMYIRADGNVDPSGCPVHRRGDAYCVDNEAFVSNASGIVIEKDSITLDGLNHSLVGTGAGLGIEVKANGVTILRVRVSAFSVGVFLQSKSDVTISGADIEDCNYRGIHLGCCQESRIHENHIINCSLDGIVLDSASACSIDDNSIFGNGGCGVFVGVGSSLNNITRNQIRGNAMGVSLSDGLNMVFHNSFVGNGISAHSEPSNTWDRGYPFGGNYWSDYAGADADSDDIGDAAYVINVNNKDNFPLMNPWTPPDLAVLSLETSKSVVGDGFTVNVTTLCENRGNKIENCEVRLYANVSGIASQSFLLRSGQQVACVFNVNASGSEKGNYSLRDLITPLEEETSVADNNCTDGWVFVTIPGDINGDFRTDLKDLVLLAKAYGSTPGDANWNGNADIDGNGDIRLTDLVTMATHYGEHFP
jgi:parallel beta-helix repeat protein